MEFHTFIIGVGLCDFCSRFCIKILKWFCISEVLSTVRPTTLLLTCAWGRREQDGNTGVSEWWPWFNIGKWVTRCVSLESWVRCAKGWRGVRCGDPRNRRTLLSGSGSTTEKRTGFLTSSGSRGQRKPGSLSGFVLRDTCILLCFALFCVLCVPRASAGRVSTGRRSLHLWRSSFL